MTAGVTVIGLDAATPDVVNSLVEADELPNLLRLMGIGSYGTLRSTTHPLTPHAWTTMVTGVNAGRHGVWDFSEREAGGYRLRTANGASRCSPAVWDWLSETGRRTGLINVPFTWPAPALSGFALAGMDAGAMDEGMTYPAELLKEIKRRFGEIITDHEYPLGQDGRLDLDLVRRSCEQKVELALWLCERFEPELLMVVFMSADHVQHLGWDEWRIRGTSSRVAATYRLLDEAVGALASASGPQSDVLVVSDHGAGTLEGVVNLNAWLAEHGYLRYASARAELGRQAFSRLFAARHHVPRRLRTAIKQRAPSVRDRAHGLRDYSVIDWSRTEAFSYGTFGNIVVNVRGREPSGIVEPGRGYERVRSAISDELLELRDQSGRKVVRTVHRREELYAGPEIERVPDLIVEFDNYAWLGKGSLRSRSSAVWDTITVAGGRHEYVGSHRLEGVFLLAGPSARPGAKVEASITDVAPTILYLLGEQVPSSLEGSVVIEALDASLLKRRPPLYLELELPHARTATGPPADASIVETRLRALGYID